METKTELKEEEISVNMTSTNANAVTYLLKEKFKIIIWSSFPLLMMVLNLNSKFKTSIRLFLEELRCYTWLVVCVYVQQQMRYSLPMYFYSSFFTQVLLL